MAYIDDFGKIQAKIDNYEWARSAYDAMKRDVDSYIENYHDDVSRRTGWGHNYICEKCGTGLKYDKDRPVGQLCPACGHINMGWRANDCWNSSYRGAINGCANRASILYKLTGDRKYFDFIVKVLNFYLENYQKLQTWVVHPMYLGRITGQHLTDDGDVIALITAMTILGDELDPSFVKELGEKVFVPQAKFLKPFCYYINNIPVWDLCAIATVGMFYNCSELVDYAFESEFGLINQVSLGLTKESFWYEGSVHYHFYCINPMTNLYYYAVSCGHTAPCIEKLGSILKQMYIMPAEMAFSNCALPNPNDGWPYISLSGFAGQYDVAAACFDSPVIRWAATVGYDGRSVSYDANGNQRPVNNGGLTRLLFGIMPEDYDKYPRPAVSTRVWQDTNFSMLRKNGLEVFFKYGLIIGAHSHFDIMNMEITAYGDTCSYDISTNGYGSFLFGWQQGTLSHNTVVTDFADLPKKGRGILLDFDKENSRIKAKNEDVYPGVDYTRELAIDGETLHDVFGCEDKDGKAHTYDYMFYCTGEQSSDFATSPVEKLDGRLYDILSEITCADVGGDAKVYFDMPDKKLTMTIKACAGTKVYLFKSPTQTANRFRWGVMVRRENVADTEFVVDYAFERK